MVHGASPGTHLATRQPGKREAASAGIDLNPEPGSPATVRDDRARRHPWLYAARHTAAGVSKVVVPILLLYLAVRLAFSLPWLDWNLPTVPWTDITLPSIPWPDWNLSDWQPPAWALWLLDQLKLFWPILLGIALAAGEIRRRHKQDQVKAELGQRHGRRESAPSERRPRPIRRARNERVPWGAVSRRLIRSRQSQAHLEWPEGGRSTLPLTHLCAVSAAFGVKDVAHGELGLQLLLVLIIRRRSRPRRRPLDHEGFVHQPSRFASLRSLEP